MKLGSDGDHFLFPTVTSEANFLGAMLFFDNNNDDCNWGIAVKTRECTFLRVETLKPQQTPYMKKHSKSQQAYTQQK